MKRHLVIALRANRRAQGGLLLGALLSAAFFVGAPAIGQAPAPRALYPAALAHEPTPLPDRIALTWMGDPAHSQAVSWRSDATVATPQAQLAPISGGPDFVADAVSVPAISITPVQADLGFPNLFHTVEFTGLEPETQYLYRVGDGANWSEWLEFATASAEPTRTARRPGS
jgi:hypothetical protein